ncbi:MAG: NUDIX domain-containing protein [Anaerolineae bacterium]|nr:NUDIX domain-containing protein [Anaerolineae bacterium]
MGREEQGVSDGVARYSAVPRTLCFVEREGPAGPEVLLLRGAPHKRIWPNRYNGIGGHVERGEDIHAAALREIREEAGIAVRDLRLRAVLHVDAGRPHPGILVFVFTARHAAGEPQPTSEGTLHWVPREQALGLDLVEDLRELLPRLWARPPEAPPFFGRYYYDEEDRWVMEWTMPA